MARLFVRSNQESVYIASIPVSVPPFTFACWFRTTSITQRQYLMLIRNPSGHYHALQARGDQAGDPVSAATFVGGVADTRKSGIVANTWMHATGVWAATNSRKVYLNGVGSTPNTTSKTVTALNVTRFATISTGFDHLDGSIAEAGMWNVALTQAEINILAAGYSPLLVRPQNLALYLPFIRDDDEDLIGGLSFIAVNGPSISSHPRVFYIAPPSISHLAGASYRYGPALQII